MMDRIAVASPRELVAIARFLESVGPESVVVPQKPAAVTRDSGARYCGCGRRISASASSCLKCRELHAGL